jgi:hypothetical protein
MIGELGVAGFWGYGPGTVPDNRLTLPTELGCPESRLKRISNGKRPSVLETGNSPVVRNSETGPKLQILDSNISVNTE